MRFKYKPLEDFSWEQHGTGFKIIASAVVNFTFSYMYLRIWMQNKNAWIIEMKVK